MSIATRAGTHVANSGAPEIVEQQTGHARFLTRLSPRAPEVTHALAVLGEDVLFSGLASATGCK
jgi:hypothetical protein